MRVSGLPIPLRGEPSWLRRIADSNPEVKAIRRAESVILDLLMIAANRYSLPVALRTETRGRKLRNPHPFPRRLRLPMEDLHDPATHLSRHQSVYVEGCEKCWSREYLYFRRHPERAHLLRAPWWTTEGGRGSIEGKPRKWVDAGWERQEAADKMLREKHEYLKSRR